MELAWGWRSAGSRLPSMILGVQIPAPPGFEKLKHLNTETRKHPIDRVLKCFLCFCVSVTACYAAAAGAGAGVSAGFFAAILTARFFEMRDTGTFFASMIFCEMRRLKTDGVG